MRDKINYLVLFLCFLMVSCVPTVELTTSWATKTQVKKSPHVMVMALGNDLANRMHAEEYIITELKALGVNAIGSFDVFNPKNRVDSMTLVNTLKEKGID